MRFWGVDRKRMNCKSPHKNAHTHTGSLRRQWQTGLGLWVGISKAVHGGLTRYMAKMNCLSCHNLHPCPDLRNTHTHTSFAPVHLSLERWLSLGICMCECVSACMYLYALLLFERISEEISEASGQRFEALNLSHIHLSAEALWDRCLCFSNICVHPSLLSPQTHTHTIPIREKMSYHDFIVSLIVFCYNFK